MSLHASDSDIGFRMNEYELINMKTGVSNKIPKENDVFVVPSTVHLLNPFARDSVYKKGEYVIVHSESINRPDLNMKYDALVFFTDDFFTKLKGIMSDLTPDDRLPTLTTGRDGFFRYRYNNGFAIGNV